MTTTYRLPSVAPGTVVVAEEGRRGFGQFLLDGRHVLHADEPTDAGGHDRGPNPYELLLMALGSCTSMTMRAFAERRNWPLDRIVVRLSHSRVHARDCVVCEEKTSLLDHINIALNIEGALDEQQRGQLLAFAAKCPVHRTLSQPVQMTLSFGPVNESDIESRLDDALRMTFPASDPTAISETPRT